MTKGDMIKVMVARFNEYFVTLNTYRKRIESGDNSEYVKRLYETYLSKFVAIADLLDEFEIDVHKS